MPADNPKYQPHFHGPVQGVVIGDNNTVTIRFQSGQQLTLPFLAPPRPPYEIVGRDKVLDDLKQRLFAGESLALSALNGLPGVGKTALAVELAHDLEVIAHFRDGVIWAGLGRDPDVLALLGNWALALGLHPAEIAKRNTIKERQELLSTAIGQKRILLVADDAWQIKAALAFQVGGPNCAHLLTTRQPGIALDFAGSGLTTVTELSHADGLTLLSRLTPAAVSAEPEVAGELVKAVGSLPLALILMGRYLQKEAYSGQPRRLSRALKRLQEVEGRLHLEQEQSPPGHYPGLPTDTPLSLMAAMAVSDEALHNPARRTLYALSVFPPKPNTFSEEAAVAVSNELAATLDTLTDYGLLEVSGPGRYTLHQAIADYAALNRTDGNPHERLVTFFVDYVQSHEREYDALEQEMNNVLTGLDVAYTRGMQPLFVQGTNALYHFLEVRGLYELAERFLKQAEQTARAMDDATSLATTLLHLGRIEERRGAYDQAQAYFQEGLALAREVGHRERISDLLQNLGVVAMNRGAYDQAQAYYQEGLALARELGHSERISALLQNLGFVAMNRGAYDQAQVYLQEGLALACELGHRTRISGLLANLGAVAGNRGAYDQAQAYLQEGLALARELGHRTRISGLLANLGGVAERRGAYDQAQAYYQEGLALTRELGHRERISLLLASLGAVAVKRETYDQAQVYFQEGLALAYELGHQWLISAILTEWGESYLKQHSWGLAADAFREALEISQKIGLQEFAAKALYGLAQVALAQKDVVGARKRGGESLALFEAIGYTDAAKVREWLAELGDESEDN